MQYLGIEIIDIPSGMGGTLPAAIAEDHGNELQVICLHEQFFTDWLLTVNKAEIKPCSYTLTPFMKNIIQRRKSK